MMDYQGVLDDYYDELRDQWAADRARKEDEWERDVSGWVEDGEEADDVDNN